MKLIVTDASLWVSRLVPEDTFHERIKTWMSTQRSENIEFLAPSLLLAEIGGAISRRTGKPALGLRAIEQIKSISGLRLIEMEHSLAELGLRGADSLYVAVAVRLSLPLVTLDIDQKARAGTPVSIQEIL